MSELLEKQVNVEKEKSFRGSCKLLQAYKKCAMKMKQTNKEENKNDVHVKMLLMEGALNKAYTKNL